MSGKWYLGGVLNVRKTDLVTISISINPSDIGHGFEICIILKTTSLFGLKDGTNK